MSVRIEFNEAIELLNRAVAERGADYVYREDPKAFDAEDEVRCVNTFDDGTPGCIVGQVCFYAGLDAEDLASNRFSPVDTLVAEEVLNIDSDVIELLSEAQSRQDGGDTWGKAVQRAIEKSSPRYGS